MPEKPDSGQCKHVDSVAGKESSQSRVCTLEQGYTDTREASWAVVAARTWKERETGNLLSEGGSRNSSGSSSEDRRGVDAEGGHERDRDGAKSRQQRNATRWIMQSIGLPTAGPSRLVQSRSLPPRSQRQCFSRYIRGQEGR